MKKIIQTTLLLLALLLPSTANAYDFTVDGIYYSIYYNTQLARNCVSVEQGDYKYSGDVVIPETVTSYSGIVYPVTNIGDDAFKNCINLTSITIGNSVTTIGESAFSGCSGLTSANIGNSVLYIDEYAFNSCSALANVNIPSSVKNICKSAFIRCSSLTCVNINDLSAWCGISFGDEYANPCYYANSNLYLNGSRIYNLIIPNSVTRIGRFSFYGCSSITSISMPSSVTDIGRYAFYGCSNVTSITIPNSVTTIDLGAFCGCSNLANISIPNSVTSIGPDAFSGTKWYNNQSDGVVYAGLVAYKYKGTMPAGINASLTLRENTKGIAGGAFNGCNGLTSITIPNSVICIGTSAFKNCNYLTSINIPDSVTTLGAGAFMGCKRLNSVTIGISVTSIGDDAFDECDSIKELNWNARYCDTKGGMIANNIEHVAIGTEVELLPYNFVWGSKITSIDIPNSVTSIESNAFYDCSNLTSELTIPNSVTYIGNEAFAGCIGLNEIKSYIEDPSSIAMGNSVFYRYPSNYNSRTLYVPVGSSAIYQANTKWSQYFGSIVEMEPDSILATSIEIDMTETVMNEGETVQLTATVLPEDATDRTVTWASSNEAVATVNENGLVTAVASGSAIITATTTDGSNLNASCNVTVLEEPILAESIQLNVTTAGLNEGATLQLTATVLPEGASCASVIWASSDPSIATVDGNGLVTTHGVGTATITVITTDGSNLSASCTVTLLPVGVKGDVNGDNNISIADVTSLIDMLLSGSY